MAELSLFEEIQSLINIGVDPTVAATTVNNERTRRAPPAGSNPLLRFFFILGDKYALKV